MRISELKKVYFIGIGGIGMSAIARYFNNIGIEVSGYDKTSTDLTNALIQEGIQIHFEDDISLIPNNVDLVIYTPAIPKDHKGFIYLSHTDTPMIKRAEALGIISNGTKSICIAGTHGKTTTSSMTAYLLRSSGLDCTAFLGGIAKDYDSNYVIGSSDLVVLEADEFDRSFLKLSPYIATVSSMDPDHLDIYGDHYNMLETGFKAYIDRVVSGGTLIIKEGLLDQFSDESVQNWRDKGVNILQFGYSQNVDIRISDVHVSDGRYCFNIRFHDKSIHPFQSNMPGQHNVENSTVAATIGYILGANIGDLQSAILTFGGIKRRFEKIVETKKYVYIDDYAHHPSELDVAIDAARKLYPNKKLTGIFQPHLYSRTQDFVDGFANSLDKLDEIILLDIYPARELPIAGVTSQLIFDKITNKNKTLTNKAELMNVLASTDIEVLLTLGAGDIDTFVQKVRLILEK